MKSGNQFDEQAHCYDDLNGANSNAGESNSKGNQWNDDVSYGGGSSGKGSSSEMTVDGAKAMRGKAGGKETY